MDITLRADTIQKILEKVPDEEVKNEMRWRSGNDRVKLTIENLDPLFFEELRKVLEGFRGTSLVEKTALTTLQNFDTLNAEYTGDKVTRLEQLVSAFRSFFNDSPNKWVFQSDNLSQRLVPMYINDIVYYPDEWEVKGKRRILVSAAHVTMTMSYILRSQRLHRTITFYRRDINRNDGTSLVQLLRYHELMKETRKAFLQYEKQIERYKEVALKTGHQFSGVGYGFFLSNTGGFGMGRTMQPMVRNGMKAKVVIDDDSQESNYDRSPHGASKSSDSYQFWRTTPKVKMSDIKKEEDLDDMYGETELEEATKVQLPVWPYIKAFDLGVHEFCELHIDDIEDYNWDETVFDKLILPNDHKRLIQILVNGTNNLMEDIIAGKTGGIIVLATGKPGVGKTLTAEVYSEFIQRPVYSIQCSQLGLNVDSIEKNLLKVLERAQRWNALLLLDEADVYIRHRGQDLHHNAIVGVFLRILEYYRGVLFMTSNLGTTIDDAILSRATAHIRYEMPDSSQQRELWNVLGTQYKQNLGDELIASFLEEFPDVAGRDIKSMLKLASLIANDGDGVPIDLDLMRVVYKFQDTAESMTQNDQQRTMRALAENHI